MPNPGEQFDTLFKQFTHALPQGMLSLHQDLEKNLRIALESMLHRMNIVTREEFDVQNAVLVRTRERLEALEKRVIALEEMQSKEPNIMLAKTDISPTEEY